MSYVPSFMNVEVSTRFALQQFESINEFNNLRDKKKVIFDKIESFKQISNEKLYNDNDKVIKNAKEVNNENYILNIEKDNMNKKFLELKNIISKSNDVNSDAKKYFSNLNFDQYFQKEKGKREILFGGLDALMRGGIAYIIICYASMHLFIYASDYPNVLNEFSVFFSITF